MSPITWEREKDKMNIHLRKLIGTLLVLWFGIAALICVPAVTSAKDSETTLQAMVSSDEQLTFEGKVVKPKELPAKLKSAGAKPDTMIRILIQKNTPEATIKNISRALANAGFRKFVFTQPKQAEVTIKDGSNK